MSRESLVLLVGAVVLLTPSLGIPDQWKFYVLTGAGVLLIIVGYILRRSAYLRSIEDSNGIRSTESYVESARHDPIETEREDVGHV